ncbi:hypothetical protein Vretimale_136 [Volvox reticuliferus]|uniref:GPI mannosyltransferase 1 n=1 Tax=Volvox reticuliferus TaxID=1737510 RepID=A0A8J4FY40_9CHLO|nr:hypothetical protein Vretifemale_8201 [Volvox reticuliferus]GIL93928.1 hypothetical protein Vretimale_136 [Volvox reticuliferus]
MWLERIRPWQVILLAGVVRAVLICWAEYQDHHLPVKYTDIDYIVFTDAARFVAAGGSPYQRATYRYSPLLAYLMLPNIGLHPAWGKVLFSVSDLAAAGLLDFLLLRCGASRPLRSAALLMWLFNPYSATISTRGSCDVLSALLLLGLLAGLLYGKPVMSGALYGLAVHFRIYPVIYGPSIALYLMRRALVKRTETQNSDCRQEASTATEHGTGENAVRERTGMKSPGMMQEGEVSELRQRLGGLKPGAAAHVPVEALAAVQRTGATTGGTQRRSEMVTMATAVAAAILPVVLFGVAASTSFLLLGGFFYRLYGREFLQEAFLHHLTRKDPRHNFSPYYYPVYLSYGNSSTIMYDNSSRHEDMVTTKSALSSLLQPLLTGMLVVWRYVRRVVPVYEPWRLAMVPQAAALLALAVRFHEDLPAAWVLQTWCFVTFNKVITAQYFVWYLSLLPLVLPALAAQRAVPRTALVAGGAVWVAAQLHWLAWAYKLEMKGQSVHVPLWVAGLLFQAANTGLMVLLIRALLPRKLPPHHRDDDDDGGSSSRNGAVWTTFLEASLLLCRQSPHHGVANFGNEKRKQQ